MNRDSHALTTRTPWSIAIWVAIAVAYGCDTKSGVVVAYDDCVLEHSKAVTSPAILDTIKTSCKQKHPKTFDFSAIAKAANVRDWTEVASLEETRALSDQEKDAARNQYFLEVIQPRIHPDFVGEARTQFESFARGIERQVAKTTAPQSASKAKSTALDSRPQALPANPAAQP